MAVSAAVVMFPGSDAGVVTIVALMIVAAVFDIVMVVASGFSTILQGTDQAGTGIVTVAVFVVITAVFHTVMTMSPGFGAVLHTTDLTLADSRAGLGTSMTAVGRNGGNKYKGRHQSCSPNR